MTAFSPIASVLAALSAQLPAPSAPPAPEVSAGFLELLEAVEVPAEDDGTPAPLTKGKRVEEPDAAVAAWAVSLTVPSPAPVAPENAPVSVGLPVVRMQRVPVEDAGASLEERSETEPVVANWEAARVLEGEAPLRRVAGERVDVDREIPECVTSQPQATACVTEDGEGLPPEATKARSAELPPEAAAVRERRGPAAAPSAPEAPAEVDRRPAPDRAVLESAPRKAFVPAEPDTPQQQKKAAVELGEAPRRGTPKPPPQETPTPPPMPVAMRSPSPEARPTAVPEEDEDRETVGMSRAARSSRGEPGIRADQDTIPPRPGWRDLDVSSAPPTPAPASSRTVIEAASALPPADGTEDPIPREVPARRSASPAPPMRNQSDSVIGRPAPAEPTPAPARPHLAFAARLTPAKEPAERVESKSASPLPEAPATAEAPPAWALNSRETAASAERSDAPPSEAPKTQEAKPVSPRRAAPLPAPVARDIRLEVGEPDRKVELRVVERGGEVRVAVRTPDDRLADGLREQLPSLASRLEQHGFRADEWKAAAAGGTERRLDVDAPAAGSDNTGQQQGQPQERGQERRDSEPRPHGDAEQQSRRQKEKGNPFAWLMESLR